MESGLAGQVGAPQAQKALVVDGDGHVVEPPDTWAARMDRARWGDLIPRHVEQFAPGAEAWFVGGELNAAYNCVDRHVLAGRGDKVAYHWEGEPGDTRTITYADLLREVCKAANALTELGLAKGDACKGKENG